MRAEPGHFQTGLCYNQTDPTADLPAPLRLRFDGSHAPRPVHPREIHQGANGRQEAGCGIFRTLPERPLPDRGRELAPPAISEYRNHHEAPARADRRRWLIGGWKRRFDEPIPLPRGRQLVTLADSGKYVTRLAKAEHQAAEWQAAMEALILVATSGGPTMFARIGVMRALNRGHVREFNPSRKDPHWGRRKLKRDM